MPITFLNRTPTPITFHQTTPGSFVPCFPPNAPAPSGYIYSASGFLPECVRPTDLVNRSWLVPSDQGILLPYSFDDVPANLPTPINGYILQITNEGGLVIKGSGTFGNVIPAGNHSLLPTDVTYIIEPTLTLKCNTQLSTGRTDNSQLIGNSEISALLLQRFNTLRDSHINDAYNGVAGWAWNDNSTIADKVNAPLNVLVAVGKKGANGCVEASAPVALTNFTTLPGSAAFDTAVAINRKDSTNIIVSYTVFNFNDPSSIFGFSAQTFRAVSFDGGASWPINAPTQTQPTSRVVGDNPGVMSDKYGNIWYLTTDLFPGGTEVNQPYLVVSTDKGITFDTIIYAAPIPPVGAIYDFPQITFGGGANGTQYGIYFVTDFFPANSCIPGNPSVDGWPAVTFIPIYGFNDFGAPTPAPLSNLTTQFENVNFIEVPAASDDGRLWYLGYPSGYGPALRPAPMSGISTMRLSL